MPQHQPLTDLLLRAAKPPERGTATLWDGTLKHFGVRISCGGAKSFIILLGSGRRQAIGRYPTITLAKAREKAKAILAERTLGKHRPNSISWKKVLEFYLAHVKTKNRPRTYDEYERGYVGTSLSATRSLPISPSRISPPSWRGSAIRRHSRSTRLFTSRRSSTGQSTKNISAAIRYSRSSKANPGDANGS